MHGLVRPLLVSLAAFVVASSLAHAAERSIDKEVVLAATPEPYAYFDRAWGNVLGNLKKRFETGPVDWTAWLEQMRKITPKN